MDDVVGEVLKKNKFVKESNADDVDDKDKQKNIQPDPNKDKDKPKVVAAPHFDKAQQHLANLQKEREARDAEKVKK
jgi:hypothetical protein